MNCTARSFVNQALASVMKQLRSTGVHEDAVESELSYHFDPGYSFGEQQSECKLFGNQRV
ncbi:unnamed protein product [Durusdinium trenchii]